MSIRISGKEFAENVLESRLPVIVDFYSDACIACKRLAPILADAEERYAGQLQVYKVNTSYDVELAKEYGISVLPTLVYFRDGAALGQLAGATGAEELESWIGQYKEGEK